MVYFIFVRTALPTRMEIAVGELCSQAKIQTYTNINGLPKCSRDLAKY